MAAMSPGLYMYQSLVDLLVFALMYLEIRKLKLVLQKIKCFQIGREKNGIDLEQRNCVASKWWSYEIEVRPLYRLWLKVIVPELGSESGVYNFLRLCSLLVLCLFYAKKTFLATLMMLTMHDYFLLEDSQLTQILCRRKSANFLFSLKQYSYGKFGISLILNIVYLRMVLERLLQFAHII